MIVSVLFGLFALIVMLTLLMLKSDPAENEDDGSADDVTGAARRSRSRWTRFQWQRNASRRSPQLVSEKVILAMARRGVYDLKTPGDQLSRAEDGGEYGRWSRDFLLNMCYILDESRPNALRLERFIDGYCNQIERACEQYQAKLIEYNNLLSDISEVRSLLQHEMYNEYRCEIEEEPMISVSSCRDWVSHQTVQSECPILPIIANTEEEYFMAVCDEFITGNSVSRLLSCSKECPPTPESVEHSEPEENPNPVETPEATEPIKKSEAIDSNENPENSNVKAS